MHYYLENYCSQYFGKCVSKENFTQSEFDGEIVTFVKNVCILHIKRTKAIAENMICSNEIVFYLDLLILYNYSIDLETLFIYINNHIDNQGLITSFTNIQNATHVIEIQ